MIRGTQSLRVIVNAVMEAIFKSRTTNQLFSHTHLDAGIPALAEMIVLRRFVAGQRRLGNHRARGVPRLGRARAPVRPLVAFEHAQVDLQVHFRVLQEAVVVRVRGGGGRPVLVEPRQEGQLGQPALVACVAKKTGPSQIRDRVWAHSCYA